MTLKDTIMAELEELSNEEQIEVHNAWCETQGYWDDFIERVSEIDGLYSGVAPSEIIERFSSINIYDDYYILDGYGHAQSFDYYTDSPCQSFDEIAEYCADYEDSLNNDRLQNAIDEWLEENSEPEDDGDSWSHGGEDAAMDRYFEKKYGVELGVEYDKSGD